MNPHLISPPGFVERMEQHWTGPLGNVSSGPLRAAWLQMATAFGRHILAHGDPDRGTEWTILQASTGAGKSQGAAVYCAMLARYETPAEHPGVLIVTRRIEDANEMAANINALAGRQRPYAKAYHSEAAGVGVLESLADFPVLVITHRAYELALDRLGSEGSIRQTWPYFHSWGGFYTRRLVIIDEALDIVEESQGELAGLRMTLAAIPDPIRSEHRGAVDAVKAVVSLLEQMVERSTGPDVRLAETILLHKAIDQGTVPDLTGLRAALRSVRFDRQLHKSDPELNRSQWKIHDDRLRQLDTIFRSWVYYSKLPRVGHTLNTARLLVPDEVKGAVVLDATATANLIYELFEHAKVERAPSGVRSYKNVTLHVSRGHKVGKVAMRHAGQDGDQLLRAVFADLNARIPGRSAFVVSHQETEPRVMMQRADFTVFTGHWNAITGANRWRECDVAVVIGLPYRPDTWTANTFMALQGVQTTDWLRSDHRPFNDHKDIRAAIKRGQVVSDVTQAINRIRCRTVIDGEGNCPPADVFLLLPNGSEGDGILAGIVDLMEGIKVTDWHLSDAPVPKKRGRRAGAAGIDHQVAAAHAFLRARMPGKTSKSEIRGALRMSDKAWDALVASAPGLRLLGIDYRVEQAGKVRKAAFHKV